MSAIGPMVRPGYSSRSFFESALRPRPTKGLIRTKGDVSRVSEDYL